MCLERADGALGDVSTVDVWWDKLKLVAPLLLDQKFVGSAALVVEYLQVNAVAVRLAAARRW